jgi:hypothetical protein
MKAVRNLFSRKENTAAMREEYPEGPTIFGMAMYSAEGNEKPLFYR